MPYLSLDRPPFGSGEPKYKGREIAKSIFDQGELRYLAHLSEGEESTKKDTQILWSNWQEWASMCHLLALPDNMRTSVVLEFSVFQENMEWTFGV